MIERVRLERLEQALKTGSNAIVRLLASIIGVGVETADMLVQEIFHETCATEGLWARYVGLTGSPDESRSKRREKGLAKSGNARVTTQRSLRFMSSPRRKRLRRQIATAPAASAASETMR